LDRGVIIGQRTFGKGLVQTTRPLSYNSQLKVTTAKYYIPSGRCIQKLDYSSRENGTVDEVADSLIKPFKTIGGRTVFDGRGVAPDMEVESEDLSNILGGLFRNQLIFKYATEFVQKSESIADPEQFDLGDEGYSAFVDYALAQDFSYDTRTEKILEELKK